MTHLKYWDESSFGSGAVPENWEDICAIANDLIDQGNDSEELWEMFCASDELDGLSAVYR